MEYSVSKLSMACGEPIVPNGNDMMGVTGANLHCRDICSTRDFFARRFVGTTSDSESSSSSDSTYV